MVELIADGLCHEFKVNGPGKYDCVKSFYAVNVKKLPHTFPPLLHVTKLKLEPGEKFNLAHKVFDPDSNEIYHINAGEIDMTELPETKTIGLFFVLDGVEVRKKGRYVVALFKDGIHFAETPFEVGVKGEPSQVKSDNKTHH